MTMQRIRVGNGCGFWGDQPDAPVLLVQHGHLDFLTLEYLAELTMSILAQQRQRDTTLGYATDFLEVLERLVPLWREQPQLRIVTNAGGLNPLGCAKRAAEIITRQGLHKRIGVVLGDDLTPRLDELLAAGHALNHLDTGEPLQHVRDRVVTANVYLGAEPIVAALVQGADLVISGRVADASLTVAPAVWAFGWSWQDYDKLAAATVAGTPDRMWRPGDWGTIYRLAGRSGLMERRLSHCRIRIRWHGANTETGSKRGLRYCKYRARTITIRNRRPECLYNARRRCRFYFCAFTSFRTRGC
jgi:hypothetical protein